MPPAEAARAILAAVHDEHMAGWTGLDRGALRMRRIAEDVELVQVFTRRDIAQREGLPDHIPPFSETGLTS